MAAFPTPRPVVLKFGGTSVQDAEAIARLVAITADRLAEQPLLVVSALAGVTDRLGALAPLALAGQLEAAEAGVDELARRHHEVASQLRLQAKARPGIDAAIDELAAELRLLLRGIAAVGELTERTQAAVLGFGERLAPGLVRGALEAAGVRAVALDARQIILTDDQYLQAQPLVPETRRRCAERLVPALAAGQVPVLGGFIAATRQGVATVLGRGGSDFSAALLGALTEARRIEIWTDVDGMLTADPRVCAPARRIKVLSFQEAAELAYFGAKVLHPATLLPAMEHAVPVWILNSRAWRPGPPDGARTGTLITSRPPRAALPFKGISCKRGIVVLDVVSTRMLQAHGFLKAIWDVFAQYRCPVDMVSTSEVSVSLTIADTAALPEIVDELGRFADVRFEGRKALLCLVGDNLRAQPGLPGEVFAALGPVHVRMISQGASEINIGMVLEDDDVPAAMLRLHRRFFAASDPAVFAEEL